MDLDGLVTSKMLHLLFTIPILIFQLINCSKERKQMRKRKRPAQVPRSLRSDPPENPSKSEKKSRNPESERSSHSAIANLESPKRVASGQIPQNETETPIKSEKIVKEGPGTLFKSLEIEAPGSSETTEGIFVPIGQSAGAVPTKSSLTDMRSPQQTRSVSFSNRPKKLLKNILL